MENIGGIILLLPVIAIIGHIVYELFFKKKFKSYAIDDFRQTRIEREDTEYASIQENEEADNLLDEIFNSWTIVDKDGDDEFRSLLKNKQMKNSTTLLNAVITIAPTDEGVINRLNELSDEINNCNKRQFNGSKTLIIITLAMFVLTSLISSTWAGAPFFIGSVIFYILASFTPQFVINRKIVNGNGGKRSFMTAIIGGLFGTIASAKTIKYIDRDTKQVVDTDNSETWISMALTFIVFFLLSIFIAAIGLINYIRNYWLNI